MVEKKSFDVYIVYDVAIFLAFEWHVLMQASKEENMLKLIWCQMGCGNV